MGQVRFSDQVHPNARKAAMVPIGKYDLFSQLFGAFFATITFPPSPSLHYEKMDDNSSMKVDLALSNAHYFTNLGQLEEALQELNDHIPLNNQVSIILQDWKKCVEDRIEIEKVRKIIQMECAALN